MQSGVASGHFQMRLRLAIVATGRDRRQVGAAPKIIPATKPLHGLD
jgi:hypothetical protein